MADNKILGSAGRKNAPSYTGKYVATRVILLGTTVSLSPEVEKKISHLLKGIVNWEYLLKLAEYHGVTPLLAFNLFSQSSLKNQIPDLYKDRFEKIYNNSVYKSIFLSNELANILSLFKDNGIDVVCLKGTVLGEQLYVNPGLRDTNDIDILVKPEKVPQAGKIIENMGYTLSTFHKEVKHSFHHVYYKKSKFPFMIELHWDLKDQKIIQFPVSEIWHRARACQVQGSTTMILSPEDNLLYLTNNIFTQDGQQLKYLCDITQLLKIYHDSINWDLILKLADSWGIPTTYYSLKWARELLGAQVPELILKALKPVTLRRWVINLLMDNRTFCSPVEGTKLRNETLILVRSLMASQVNQSVAIISKYRGVDRKDIWLRTICWIPVIFIAALWQKASRFLTGWKLRD